MKKDISISLDPEIIKALDIERGSIPRSTYINDILWFAFLANEEQVKRILTF